MSHDQTSNVKISRRNLLTALGTTGVLVGGGLFIDKVLGAASNSLDSTENEPILPDLKKQHYVIAVTASELRAITEPNPHYVYFIKDRGLEGYFMLDPTDTTAPDDQSTVLVTTNGHRFKRIMTDVFQMRQQWQTNVIAAMTHVSGSDQSTRGSVQSGSNQVIVDSVIDFQVGQGILVAGMSGGTKEVLSTVIQEGPENNGTLTVQLPGETAKTIALTAKKEVVQIEITSGCTQSGHLAFVIDAVEFQIPVEAGESPAQIATRLREWFFEGWTNSGTQGSAAVTLTAQAAGLKRETVFYGQGTGITATVQLQKGAKTEPHTIAAALRDLSFNQWETGGYKNANVVFFIGKSNRALGGEQAALDFANTGASGRLEVVQYGNYLVSKIVEIEGNTLTLEGTAMNSVSGVYVGHDDTAALQSALDEAAGRELYIPPGTYKLSRTLQPHAGTTIQGAGHENTLLQFQAINFSGIQIQNHAHNVTLSHLQIKNVCAPDAYYGGKDTERHGIIIHYAKGTTIAHCKFDNCDDAAIRTGYDAAIGNSIDTKVLYNIFENTAEGSAIEVIRGEDCLILGNIVRHSSQHGVRLCGARKPIAIGNFLEHNADGFSIQGFGDGRNVTQRTQDFIIEGNVVKEHILYAFAIFNQANTGLIKGNYLEGRGTPTGIFIRHVLINGRKSTNFNITIEGNIVKGFNRSMQIRGDHHRIIIKNNTFQDFTADGSASAYGIYLNCDDDGDLKDLVIEGNTFICPVKDKVGIRMFLPSANSRVHVHGNTFIMRFSNLAHENVADRCVRNMFEPDYNEHALISTKSAQCTITLPDQTVINGTTSHDTNIYNGVPS